MPVPQERGEGPVGRPLVLGLLAFSWNKVAAAVLLPAGFVGFSAEGFFLAPTGCENAIGRKAEADEIFLDGVGAALAEGEVVFGGTALVAVAFDGDADVGIIFQEVGGPLKSSAGIGTNFGGVIVEVGVTDFLEEEFVEAFRPGRGRRRRADGNADDGFGGTAIAGGSQGVGGGVDRGSGSGALRSDRTDLRSNGNVGGVGSCPGELDGFTFVNGGAICAERGGRLDRGRGRSGGGGVAATGFLLQPATMRTRAEREISSERVSARYDRVMRVLLRHRRVPCGPASYKDSNTRGPGRGICRDTIYCSAGWGERGSGCAESDIRYQRTDIRRQVRGGGEIAAGGADEILRGAKDAALRITSSDWPI